MDVKNQLTRSGVLAAFTCLLLIGTPAVAEEYYTWVDENGITNYAEKKPKGQDAQFVGPGEQPFGVRKQEPEPEPVDDPNLRRPGAAAAEEDVPIGLDGQVDPDALIAEERAKIEAKLAEDRAFNCDVGKRNLTRLEAYGRVKIRDENGETRWMTADEISEKKAESRKMIQDNCRG